MNIYESKRQLDHIKFLKATIKSEKELALKHSKKLLPSEKMLHKKTGKWCIKRNRKLERATANLKTAASLYHQTKDKYDHIKSDFIKEVVKFADIPEKNFDCISIKTSRFHNKIYLYCEIIDDAPDGYTCDCYVVDLDNYYVYAFKTGEDDSASELLASYYIISPATLESKGTAGPT